jgi:hypothetical protein
MEKNMISKIVRYSTLAAFVVLSGAAFAQATAPGAPKEPFGQSGPGDPSKGPSIVNPTESGSGAAGPAIKNDELRQSQPGRQLNDK